MASHASEQRTPLAAEHPQPVVAAVTAPEPSPAPHVEPQAPPAHVEPQAPPAHVERDVPPTRPIPELPPVALTLPPESGLELVETKFKGGAEAEPETPAGPRRVRPPKVAIAEEPLQMVETTHKDAPPPAG